MSRRSKYRAADAVVAAMLARVSLEHGREEGLRAARRAATILEGVARLVTDCQRGAGRFDFSTLSDARLVLLGHELVAVGATDIIGVMSLVTEAREAAIELKKGPEC